MGCIEASRTYLNIYNNTVLKDSDLVVSFVPYDRCTIDIFQFIDE